MNPPQTGLDQQLELGAEVPSSIRSKGVDRGEELALDEDVAARPRRVGGAAGLLPLGLLRFLGQDSLLHNDIA
jgi:hypothetical protein